MIAHLESAIGRKLNLIGCGLHLNELPLRHVFTLLDGKSTSATGFKGKIGKQLDAAINKEPVIDFEAIPTELPDLDEEVARDLSTDQNLMYRYLKGIASGQLDQRTAKAQLGPLNHSRWLTLAVRILALYSRTVEPCMELKILANFVQQVYGPFWFEYKKAETFLEGPRILHKMAQSIVNMNFPVDTPAELKENVVNEAINPLRRNAFCCLGENFLLSMIYSKDEDLRMKGIDKVIALKGEPSLIHKVRPPVLNINARQWSEMVDLETLVSAVPAYLNKKSLEELEGMRDEPGEPPNYPIHSQTVERAVKLVSEATKKSYNWDKQYMSILSTVKSRNERPMFGSKKDYVI